MEVFIYVEPVSHPESNRAGTQRDLVDGRDPCLPF